MEEQTLKINLSKEPEKPKFDEWEISSAVETIIKAEEIKENKELMALVAPELAKRVKATNNAAEVLYGTKDKENNNG